MASSVTLTVGIPTYNGSTYIRETLNSVIKQISEDLLARVDILISDNASTDSIPEIVKTYQDSQAVRIQYSRNEVNLGYDRNVDMLFKKASGQFVWILGDDDVLKGGAILQVLQILDSKKNLNVVLLSFDTYDREFSKIVSKAKEHANVLCKDAEMFLLNARDMYGQVSSLVINKCAWNKEDLTSGFGSNFIHMYGLFKVLLGGESYIVNQPLINVRLGSENSGTSGDALLSIALSTCAIFRSMIGMGYDAKIVKILIKPARRYAYDTILIAKLAGIKNKKLMAEKLIATYNGPSLWLKWMPVIFFPDRLFKSLYMLKKGISSKTRVIERKLKTLIKKRRPI